MFRHSSRKLGSPAITTHSSSFPGEGTLVRCSRATSELGMTFGRTLERCRGGLSVAAVLAAVNPLFYPAALTDQIFFSPHIQSASYPPTRALGLPGLHGQDPR